MRRMVIALATGLVACGDLPHENPYDPKAPPGDQARTSFSGSVSLEPVNGVTASLAGVQVSIAGTGHSATTDAAGAWTITGVPAGTYTIQAIAANYDTASVPGVTATLDTGGTTVPIPTIALRRVRADLAGSVGLLLPRSVVEATGGASVTLGGVARAAVTGTTGGYVIPGVPAPIGSYTLTASKLGYVAETTSVTFENGAFVVQPVQLEIDPGAFVGTVTAPGRVDGSGNPDSSSITVRARGTTLGGTPWEEVTLTAASGAYRMSGLPAGSYTVSFELADHTTLSTGASVAPGSDTALGAVALVHDTGSLSGTVTLSGAASSGGVVVTASSGARTASTVTDASGAFSFPSLETGPWVVSARKDPDWLPSGQVTVNVSRNAPASPGALTLSPVSTGSVAGIALLEGATDHSGTTVTLTGADFRGVPVTSTAVTAQSGAWSFTGRLAGSYQVSFSRTDFESPVAAGASIGTGQAVDLGTATLARSRGSVGGQFQLSGAGSSAGVVVTLQGTSFSAVTDATGAFSVASVPVGTYTVVAAKPDWQGTSVAGVAVARDAATVLPGSPVPLQPVATASIAGTALLEGGTDHSGTTVTLTGADFRGVAVAAGTTTTTGAGGAWSFTGLPAGSYQVAFSHASFDAPAPTGLSIVTGQAAAAGTLTLAASRGALGGTVTAAGAASHAGTVVEISGGPDDATAVTNAAGAWQVTGLRVATTYTATYRRDGYVTQSSASLRVDPGATTAAGAVNLAVATTGAITGVATVERPGDAASSAGILVSLTGTDLNGAPVTTSAMTVAGGGYTLTGLPQGTYTLAFSKARYDAQQAPGIAVVAGGTATAPPVTLPVATGSIAGQVVLSSGTAAGFVQGTDYSGVVVTLTGLEPGVTVAAAVTDASGGYRLDGVPVHTSGLAYGIVAQKGGYGSGAASVVAAAGTTVTATPSPLTLTVSVGSVSGNVAVNDTGSRAAPVNGTVTVTVAGTAFNATAFSASATNVGSGFGLPNLPAGTYELVATSADRTCTTAAAITVSAGQALDLALVPPDYTFVCTDAVAPGAVSLGVPQGAGAEPGFTAATSVNVPVALHAADGTLNLAGYQYVAGPVPSWDGAPTTAGLVNPIPFPAGTLSTDGTWTLWVRAVDQVGNAGPASSVEIVRDATRPANVALTTARPYVNDTTTTALVSGGADANFRSYQTCTALVSATGTCAQTCTMADTGATITVSFASANTKACVYAQAADEAGNTSATVQRLEILSDLTPPTAPVMAPIYDPTILSVHAAYVDFFVTRGATDGPAGGTTPWRNVAWLEVDVGGGYRPLCPFAACRTKTNEYSPCGCGCDDARLVCDGSTFKAIRVPLLDGAANSIGIRAVDLAGNVGSGITQQVPTATSLYPVAVEPPRENNPRGRGRLLGYRYTDSYLRLRDLGEDGRADASDNVCEVGTSGAWGGVVPRVAVLGPRVVVHADGDATIQARRPGPDALFCSTAADDTTYALYTIPGTVYVRNVTGSYNHARTGEYAAWLERDRTTNVDVVKVQAPNARGLFAHSLWYLFWNGSFYVPVYTDPPAPVTLYTAGASAVFDLLEGGDCLLSDLRYSSPRFRVDCKAGGLGSATGVTTWTLPTTAQAASMSADGLLIAWAEYDGPSGATRLRVRSAGSDRLYGTGDDSEATRLGPGAYASPGSMALGDGHVVVSESAIQGSYWLLDWNAGPDAVFDGSTEADDTVSRVLPSSVPRESLSVLAGGQVAYSVEGDGGNLSDVLMVDLSTYRWETVEASGLANLATNGAGTRFFSRGGTLTARLPNGTEQQAPFSAWTHAATGSHLITSDGATVDLHDYAAGSWFGSSTTIYSGSIWAASAGGKWGLMLVNEGGTRYRVADLSDPSPVTTLLPIVPGSGVGSNGYGISDTIAAYQCNYAGWNACVHHPGADRRFGTADDQTLVLVRPGTANEYGAFGLAVGGDKVAFSDENRHMIVVATGPDGVFNSSDDVEYDLGDIGSPTQGNIAVAGNYAAWLRSTANGIQVMYADLALGFTRQLTTHYSNKESLALDPSGRLTWIDYGFTTPAIFVYSP